MERALSGKLRALFCYVTSEKTKPKPIFEEVAVRATRRRMMERARELAKLVTEQANVESRNRQALKNIDKASPEYLAEIKVALIEQGWKVAKRKDQLVMTR